MTLEKFLDAFKSIPNYDIELGVYTSDKPEKHKGVTNAELMFIHEYGSPARKIPARPVLQMTINHANSTMLSPAISKAIDKYVDSGFVLSELEKQLSILGMKMEQYAQDIIYLNDGRLKENAPSTIRAKGMNHPLFVTGELARSITSRLIKFT